MNYKIIIWILMVLVTVYSASALITTNITTYYSMDNTSVVGAVVHDLSPFTNNLTLTNAVSGKKGKLNESIYCDGVGDKAETDLAFFNGLGNWSISFWVNSTAGPTNIMDNLGGLGNNRIFILWGRNEANGIEAGNLIVGTTNGGGVVRTAPQNNPNINDGAWHLVTFRYNADANTSDWWIDGVDVPNAGTVSGGDIADGLGHRFCQSYLGTSLWTGYLDEFSFWTKYITDAEIGQLWNGGAGFNPYAGGGGGAAKSITINYSSPVYEESLTQHTILFENYNITNSSLANLTYNNSVYNGVIDWTNSSYVEFIVNLTTPFVYNNNTALPFNWTYQIFYSNGSNLTNATNNYNQYVIWNLTKYPRINITAFAVNGSQIMNFSLSSSERNLSTTTGEIYYWTNATKILNISIDAPGYAVTWALINFTSGSFGAYNFSLYTTNSIMFYFRDEESNNLVNNVSIELISTPFSNNYSTTNGTLYVDLLSPATYTMRYISNGYFERFYYFTLINRTFTNLTLYLLSNSTGSEVRATVYDENNFEVENVYIKVLRYDLVTNSYKLVEIAKTNFEGQTNLHLILNDEFYQFMIEYPFGTLNKITSPTYIYETTLTFQIVAQSEVGERFYKAQDLTYDLSFNNATNNFRLSYTDSDNLISQVCLKIWKVSATKKVLYNQSCLTSPSGTILLGVTNSSGTTYNAQAYAYFSNPAYYLTGLTHTFEAVAIAGLYGIFLIMILTIIFAVGIGWWSKSLALILTPLPLMLGSILNIIDLSIGMCISIEIICVIVAYWISRRQ